MLAFKSGIILSLRQLRTPDSRGSSDARPFRPIRDDDRALRDSFIAPQRPTYGAARRTLRVGKINNLDAEPCEAVFQGAALLSATPVVTLKQNVEAQLLPDFGFVVGRREMRHVHESHIANYLQSVRFWNNRRDLLVLNEDVVRDHSRDEE